MSIVQFCFICVNISVELNGGICEWHKNNTNYLKHIRIKENPHDRRYIKKESERREDLFDFYQVPIYISSYQVLEKKDFRARLSLINPRTCWWVKIQNILLEKVSLKITAFFYHEARCVFHAYIWVITIQDFYIWLIQ